MKLLKEKEFLNLVKNLENPVDKFLLTGLYYGISGGESFSGQQLFNIKKSDVNLKKSVIRLDDGSLFEMNETFNKITKEAINQKTYIKLGSFENGTSTVDYDFNESSEFVFRIKPTKNNNQGLNPISKDGFKTRMKGLSKFLDVNLGTNYIREIGAYRVLSSVDEKLTVDKAENILKENNLSIRREKISKLLKVIEKEGK